MKRPIVVVILSVVLTSCSVSEHMPDRAELIIDEEYKTYASPPCVIYGTTERDLVENPTDAKDPGKKLMLKSYAEVTTVGDLRARRKTEKGWRPDEKCRDASGFFSKEVSFLTWMFGQEKKSRWTPEGDWRW